VRIGGQEIRMYEYGFDKYDITRRTGLESEELTKAAQGLIRYFNSNEEPIQVRVVKSGEEFELFNQREVIHLRDVKNLIQTGYKLLWISLAYVLIYILCFIKFKRQQWRDLAHSVMLGCGISLGLIAVFGIAAFFNFDQVFLQFHLFSFDNSFWKLDPRTDYLIAMFPQGFFFDIVIFGGAGIALEALVIGGIAKWLLRSPGKKELAKHSFNHS
jgi:integral membrane protein (TIGR01906 family)